MTHKLGVYLCPGHKRPTDLDYIRKLQPSVVRILEPDPDDLRQVWAVAPNATIFPRYWWLDDGNRQQHAAMVADPVGTAHRHAAEWRVALQKLGVLGNPKVVVTGTNEPSVNEANVRQATVEYTKVFMFDLAQSNIRAGALCLPVGHPAPLYEGAPDWRDYMSLEPVIQQTNGVLVLHSYWQQEGPNKPEDWGWLAGRHIKCPMQVPILVGEAGIDGAIYGRYPNNVGYRGVSPAVPPNQYAEQIVWYHNNCDPRVIGICIFLSDYRDNHWSSFDLEPAYPDILARLGQLTSTPATPPTVPVAPVSPPAGTPTPPTPPQTPTGDFERAVEWVLKWEGGYVNDPHDPGGETNFGISKAANPDVDIKNLTREQAKEIYRQRYWLASGAGKLPWPLSLAQFDTAVNAGVGRANEMLAKSGGNFDAYMGHLIDWYTRIPNFDRYGVAWIRRRADLLKEAAV